MQMSEREKRNRAAKWLKIWRKTKDSRLAIKEIGTHRIQFWRVMRQSRMFQRVMKKRRGWSVGLSNNDYCFIKMFARKMAMVILLGGKCIDCGESNLLVLDFHHPGDKEDNLANLRQKKLMVFVREAYKCELLCGNCHKRRHANVDKFNKFLDLIKKKSDRMVKMLKGVSINV